MNHRRIFATALVLVIGSSAALAPSSFAADAARSSARASFVSAFALPIGAPEGAEVALEAIVGPGAIAIAGIPRAPRLDAVRYRPRYSGGRSRGPIGSSPAQMHLGFFDPSGGGATSFALGFRGGPSVDPHVQVGLGADWYHKSESQTVVAGDPFVQGGNVIQPERVLSRASTNLFPISAFIQVGGGEDLSVIPYFGLAADYQVLLLSATDFQTQTDFSATYGGWGWQAWGGAALPLSGQSRLFGELFVNQGDVERDVDSPNGYTYRERVDTDGVGMRFGLSWGF
jgi:hypothetical protein